MKKCHARARYGTPNNNETAVVTKYLGYGSGFVSSIRQAKMVLKKREQMKKLHY
jgi:hypothetical protein